MPANEPIVIYLDSSDYSTLTRPHLDLGQSQQLVELQALTKRKDIKFAYSGAHISEMSPLQGQYATAGATRTALMVALCGRTTMISYDRLIKAELKRLVERDPTPVDAIDTNGGWFPDMGSLVSPLDELDIAGIVRAEADKNQLNRKIRRQLQKSMTKKGGFRSDYAKTAGRELDLTDLLAKLPMRSRDAEVLKRYVLGIATRKQADDAFLESLRDPTFMSQWFLHNHDQLGAIGDWVRKPAQELLAICKQALEDLNDHLGQLPDAERPNAVKEVITDRWAQLKQEWMVEIVNRQLARLVPNAPRCDDPKLIEKYCPGLFVFIEAFYTSLRQSLGENSRQLKASDFVDFIHALYIPYVSYFKADRYMCGVMQPLAKRFGTQVVASTSGIIAALKAVEPNGG